jgi:hypothetical protein
MIAVMIDPADSPIQLPGILISDRLISDRLIVRSSDRPPMACRDAKSWDALLISDL